MGTILAGSAGWLPGKSTSKKILLSSIFSGDCNVEELKTNFKNHKSPKIVTIGVHNSCNLQCIHCYWQPQHSHGKLLTLDEQKLLIESVIKMCPKLIVLCGKEVLLGDRGIKLLTFMNDIRCRNGSNVRIGLMTNGTLLDLHKESLIQSKLDYIDLSLDGNEFDHDSLRGQGAFASIEKNLTWAVSHFSDKLFITLTISKLNVKNLTDTIKLYSSFGVYNVCIGFYKPLSYTAKEISLCSDDFCAFFESLSECRSLNMQNTINLIFDLDTLSLEALEAFLKSQWFRNEWIQYDQFQDEYYIEHYISQHFRLLFRLSPFPVGIWKICRLTPEGNYLAAEDMVNMELYPKRIISNSREFNFNFQEQHSKALMSERFDEIMDEYKLDVLPRLKFCDSPTEEIIIDN